MASRFRAWTRGARAALSGSGAPAIVGASLMTAAALAINTARSNGSTVRPVLSLDEAPGNRPGLPVYSRAEVAKHKTPETGVWVTFKDGVYDVTDFAEKHPGGNKILLAAGSAVDPFWVIYQQHNHAHVREILAKYRIGSLDPAEMASVADAAAAIGDPYAGDPPRSPLFIVHSAKPYNAEPPAQLLPDAFLTPAEVLFVRHHLPVPDIDPAKHKLTVEVQREGQPPRTVVYTLAELQARFPAHSVVAALTCSGNRRAAMAAAKEARGLAWRVGAMGNVEWRGVRLRDVLADAGVGEGDVEAGWLRHVQFEGMDRDPVAGTCYGASIPADKALDPRGDVLLAWEMNGAPLTRDHGAPLRAVVPGTTGARQVKWVGRVVASGQESASLWQQKDYKLFPPTMDWGNVDFGAMPAMQEMPVASAICEPAEGEAVPRDREGMVTVKGWAWSGGGRAITRVDVTPDGGKSWVVADITDKPADPSPSQTRSWGWTLWTAFVPVPEGSQEVQLAVRAVDVACNTQPEHPLSIWNYRGLANNAWHRVNVKVAQPKAVETPAEPELLK